MSEINNFQPQFPASPKIDNKPITPKVQEETAVTKEAQSAATPKADLPSIGLPGRSQVKPTDNVASDIDEFLKNPEMIGKAVLFFDQAYDQLIKEGHSEEESYAMAGQITKAFKSEFLN